tara:strand:+ start:408 stop:800 length:393 start_codon:yes stop_codon:yes gene_type:complete
MAGEALRLPFEGVNDASFVINAQLASGAATVFLGSVPVDCVVERITERHATKQGATSNIVVKGAASGTAIASGTALHSGNLDGDNTNDTVQFATIDTDNNKLTAGSVIGATLSAHDTIANISFSIICRPV